MIRRMIRGWFPVFLWVALLPSPAPSQTPPGAGPPQTQEDDYTRYELLAPGTGQFRILYEVTATRAGARFFFNAIRRGSVATDERVFDAASGQPLKWEVVSGALARAEGHPQADLETEWIKVHLARPVPPGGEARVVIDKTYKDDKSYFRQGDAIVFDRSLGIRRNAVVLPPGYRLVSCNVPSQVLSTPDGRVMIAFQNPGPAAAPLVVKAVPGLAPFTPTWPTRAGAPVATPLPSQGARLVERAHQDRESSTACRRPTATASRSSTTSPNRVPVSAICSRSPVRAAACRGRARAASIPATTLAVETMTGATLRTQGLDPGEPVAADGQVVVVTFPPVAAGRSVRLRVTATIIDAGGYALDGDELVWDRVLGRPRNVVVLPLGWTVTASAMPVVVEETGDGRQRLTYENARPDDMQVLIRARRTR